MTAVPIESIDTNRPAELPSVPARNPEAILTWAKNHLPVVLMLAAMVPLLIVHAAVLWGQPQYQFFPVIYLVYAVLLWREAFDRGEPEAGRRRFSYVVIGMSGLGFVGAILLHSPYFMQVAFVIYSTGLLLRYATSMTVVRVLVVSSLLLLTAIPFSGSLILSQRLQQVSSLASSGVLESIGIPHIRSGNLIETVKQTLFVEEACSGIHSLFASLCVVMILVVWQRLPFFLSFIALLSVPVWAIVGNIIRISSIAIADVWYDIDLIHGLPHTILGYVIFLVIAALLYCWIMLLTILLEPLPRPLGGKYHPPAIELYNRIVAWPYGKSWGSTTAKPANLELTESVVASAAPASLGGNTSRLVYGIAGFALLLSLVDFTVAQVQHSQSKAILFESGRLPETVSNKLPGQPFQPLVSEGWQNVGYELVTRENNSFFGEFSRTWQYRSPVQSAVFSLDYLFDDFHTLETCYINSGWEVIGVKQDFSALPSDGAIQVPVNHFLIRKPLTGEVGLVMYAEFEPDGEFAEGRRDLWSVVAYRLSGSPLLGWLLKGKQTGEQQKLFQFQVFCQRGADYSPEEQSMIRDAFLQAISNVRSSVVAATSR